MNRKIAFISEHASPLASLGSTDSGGQNVYVGELAVQLVNLGYQVDIFTRREEVCIAQIVCYQPGVRVIHVDAGPAEQIPKEEILGYMDEFRIEMLSFIYTEQITYHLIHANFWMSGLIAMQLKKLLHLPFVITFHALGKVRMIHQKEQDKFPPQRITIEDEIVKNADWIIAECPQDKDDLMNHYNADARKIAIIPCGFNPEEFFPVYKDLCRKVLNLEEKGKIILQLGRIVPRKGVDNVIRALALLPSAREPVCLIIVGGENTNPEMAGHTELLRLKQLAASLGITDRVIFAGRKDRAELKHYYGAADIFVTTPWYEPFGITPLESMACGTPVIGAEVGGIKHTVIEGQTGLLVKPDDPQMLCDKISMLLNNERLLKTMGETAQQHVLQHFTWEKVALKMRQLYERLLNENLVQADKYGWIEQAFEDAAQTFRKSGAVLSTVIAEAADGMARALHRGNKILVCGNGGSAAESQHFAAELMGRFEIPYRRALPVISLAADVSVLTAWSNDFGFDEVFARQVQAFGQKGDILLCLSTSGSSPNIIKAMEAAADREMLIITMLGKDGGKAAEYGDINMIVPSYSSQRIQEVHLHLIHLLCGLVETKLFSAAQSLSVQQKEVSSFKILNGTASLFMNYTRKNRDRYGS